MDTDFRRVMWAMAIAMAVFIGYQVIVAKLLPPPPKPATTEPATTATAPAGPTEAEPAPAAATGPASSRGTTAPAATFSSSADLALITLGGRDGDFLKLDLDPRGASVATLDLFAKNAKGRFIHRADAKVEAPYELLAAVDDGRQIHCSFSTYRIWIKEFDQNWVLDNLPWQVVSKTPEQAVFATTLRTADGTDLLRLTKTYALRPGKPVFEFDLAIENAGPAPLTVWADQNGPLGIRAEGQQYDMRQVLTAQWNKSVVELNAAQQRGKLKEAALKGEPLNLLSSDRGPFLWTALANRYFAVFTRPLPTSGQFENYIATVGGTLADPHAATDIGDLLVRMSTAPVLLAPGANVRYPFEIYAGPKDSRGLAKIDPAYADPAKLYYQLAQYADRRCSCTFGWLQDLMTWLLESIHMAVRNYGVAIIILVLVIKTLLHPLSVFQQKSMFRTQEAMARIQPRMNELRERYANDKVKQNQEMMKLWAEENVNPAANFIAFIPMFIQMPILVALWTALNTDVNLRHAPFDGWWITDLSAPDALIAFDPPVTIPGLSLIPWVGSVFTNVTGLNLLPILMGVSMWLQQKYMPKPTVHQPQGAAPTQHKRGMSPEDQLRQQQIISYMMSIMFPLMFYKMPSGLNLYWMATNVFGICESLIIRKQINEERERRAAQGPRPPKRPGPLSRFFKHIAAQAEEIQRKADDLSKGDDGRRKDQRKKP